MYQTVKRCRLYPSALQAEFLAKQFGCCRFVWNTLLAENIAQYKMWEEGLLQEKPKVSPDALGKRLTLLRKEFPFLEEVSYTSLQQTTIVLSKTFSNFFKGKGYPKFKSKKDRRQGFNFVGTTSQKPVINTIQMAKIGRIKVKNSFDSVILPSSYSIVKERSGKYYVCLRTTEPKKPNTQKGRCGIDLGLTTFATIADNQSGSQKIDNPKWYRKSLRKRARLQRRLARKQKGSANKEKQRLRLARFEETVANRRKDFLHKLSTRLVSTYRTISVEDLNIRGILKNRHLALSISDASWGEFLRQLEYKAQRFVKPIQVIRVDRWFPSTQTCSACKAKREIKLRLSERHWECPSCGTQHDRDINAAVNLLLAAR